MLYKNLFTEIPTLIELETLTRLSIDYNPVQNMDTITSFTNLTDVRLRYTGISGISTTTDELQRLSFLE